jgi:hypothetical protein
MGRFFTSVVATVFALLLLTPTPSLAVPIFGSFGFGGSSATVGAVFLDFNCTAGITGAPCPPPTDYGNFNVTFPATGAFAGLLGQGGYIHDIDQATTPAGPPLPAPFPNFIIFPTAPDIALDLTRIFLGSSGQAQCGLPAAPGQICTPIIPGLVSPGNPLGLSPYNLQNLPGNQSTASFSFAGIARRVSTGEETPFTGSITSQFAVPFQTNLAIIAGGGTITNAYSGTVTVIPEPGSSSLAVGGILLVAGFALRRLSRKK